MKKILISSHLAIYGSALVFALSGCAGGRQYTDNGQIHYKRSTGEYIDDKAMSGKVKKELVRDKSIRAGDVNVEAYQGVVQLSGFVDTEDQKLLAEKIARGVPGVQDVKNSILLKPSAEDGDDTIQAGRVDSNLTPTGKSTERRPPTVTTRTAPTANQFERDLSANFVPQKASRLLGLTIENNEKQKLGDVDDLAIDMSNGEVAYVIVSSGGLLGIGDKLHAVPSNALTLNNDQKLQLAMSKERWKSSPAFDDKDWNGLADPEREKELYSYYEVKRDFESDVAEIKQESKERLSAVGKDSPDRVYRKGDRVQMASKLIGKRVINREQDRVGHIADLLVDLDGSRGTLAIVETDNYLTNDGRFLVPATAFGLEQGERHVVLDVNRQMFEDAREFENKTWPAGSSVEIYRYEAGARVVGKGEQRVTAVDQSENKADLEITQKIRRELTANDSFSLSAKNIQVITRNGKVTLRGTVQSQREENAIVDIAQRIAGKTSVDSELEVQGR